MVVGPAVIGQEICTSLILNEVNLTQAERARLIHWRQAHRQSGEEKSIKIVQSVRIESCK
jgi:hypothetical protein